MVCVAVDAVAQYLRVDVTGDDVRAAREHHVGLAVGQQVVGVSECVVAGRTRGTQRERLPRGAEFTTYRVREPLRRKPVQ